jgi:hypothetical protein
MVTSYNIYESTGAGNPYGCFDSVTVDSSGGLATTYTATGLATGLAAGSTPVFYVTAENVSGESLGQSNTASLTDPIPTGVSNVATTVGASSGGGSTST